MCDIINIEDECLKDEVEHKVREILGNLDEHLKKPILLFYFDLLSYKEIAFTLNIPIGTVMSRIARGKVYIKNELLRSDYFRSEIKGWLENKGMCEKK